MATPAPAGVPAAAPHARGAAAGLVPEKGKAKDTRHGLRHGAVAAGFNFLLNCSFASSKLATQELEPQVVVLLLTMIAIQIFFMALILLQAHPLAERILDKCCGAQNINHFFTLVWIFRQLHPNVRSWFVGMAHEQMHNTFQHFLIGSGAADGIIMSISALVTRFSHFRVVHPVHTFLHIFTLRSALDTKPLPFLAEYTVLLHVLFLFAMPLAVGWTFSRDARSTTAEAPRGAAPLKPAVLSPKMEAQMAALRDLAAAVRDKPYGGGTSTTPQTLSLKFHDRHLPDLGPEGAERIRAAVLARSPPGAMVYVGDGCVQVTVDLRSGAGSATTMLDPEILEGILAGGGHGEAGDADDTVTNAAAAVRSETITASIDGRLVRVSVGDRGEVLVEDDDSAAAAGIQLRIEVLSPHFLAEGEATELVLRCSGAVEGDRALVMRVGPGGECEEAAMGTVGRETGQVTVHLPAASTAGGLLWARLVRSARPGVPTATLAAVSTLSPVAIVPDGGVEGVHEELCNLAESVEHDHGIHAAEALVRDIGAVFSPGGGREESVGPLLDFLVAQGAALGLSAVCRAAAPHGIRPSPFALHSALLQRNLLMLETVLEHGGADDAAITARSEGGLTPLHTAAAEPDSCFLAALLRAGGAAASECAMRARDDAGYTPLDFAAQCMHWQHVEDIRAAAKPRAPSSTAACMRWGEFEDRAVEDRFVRWMADRQARMDVLYYASSSIMIFSRGLKLPELPHPAISVHCTTPGTFYAWLAPVHLALVALSSGAVPSWSALYVRQRWRLIVAHGLFCALLCAWQQVGECYFAGYGFTGDSAARAGKYGITSCMFEFIRTVGLRNLVRWSVLVRLILFSGTLVAFCVVTSRNCVGREDESTPAAIWQAVAIPGAVMLVVPTALEQVLESRDRAKFKRWARVEMRLDGSKKNA